MRKNEKGIRERKTRREIKAVNNRVGRYIQRVKGNICRKKEKDTGRRRSKGRKEARHILRVIYVSRMTDRSRQRVELSLELSF